MELAPRSECYCFLTYTAGTVGKQNGTFTMTDDSKTAAQAIINLSGATKPQKKCA